MQPSAAVHPGPLPRPDAAAAGRPGYAAQASAPAALWRAAADLLTALGRHVCARDLAQSVGEVPAHDLSAVVAAALLPHGVHPRLAQLGSIGDLERIALPLLLQMKNDDWVLCLERQNGQMLVQTYPDNGAPVGLAEPVALSQLYRNSNGLLLQAQVQSHFSAQKQKDTIRQSDHWFWGVLRRLRTHYGDCAVATILVNVLALAASMFAMNVYDRIIPNGALNSLWVLALGVLLANVLEVGLRILRAHLLDDASKRADLVLSAGIFRQALNLKPQDRPASSGQFASQVREFESVRDFVSSSTLVAVTDVPFVFLYLLVIAFIAGPLVWVPITAALVILVIGWVIQRLVRAAVEQYQYETNQKYAFLVEAFERLETIDALGARAAIQGRWERLCAVTARSAMGTKFISAVALNGTQFVQQIASTALIVTGVYMVLQGHLTTGGIIGCSILAGRALAPLAQVAGLLARWQHTRMSYDALERLMVLEPRHDPLKTYVPLSRMDASAGVQCSNVRFSYPKSEQVVLNIAKLEMRLGETIAVMGPVGSGKSTLLRVLAGLQDYTEGQILVQGLEMRQISPADLRAHTAWVGQDPVLFRGSLRENLLMASPRVSEERFMQVMRICGVDALAAAHPQGFDRPIGESGAALSGGQRQMVALARALLGGSAILLLDEPTSAFDMGGELGLLQRLKPELQGRLVVIATHRAAPLELVQRLIILEKGQVLADGPRDAVLDAVRSGKVRRVAAVDTPSPVAAQAKPTAPAHSATAQTAAATSAAQSAVAIAQASAMPRPNYAAGPMATAGAGGGL